jgi:hypothetical protein
VTTAQAAVQQKALAINLDASIYGTVAEISAGQEVAAWLFRVGGAAGTVAKTISAYDMKVSDEIYGKAARYVSRERVVAMIGHEFELLQQRLADRSGDTRFFAFANTVAARNYAGTNECHGWLGLRFQASPGGAANDILLHVNLRDQTNERQQRALGILGINLIHAAAYALPDLASFLSALHADLSLDRIEIDLLHLAGPDVPGAPDCEIGLQLVRRGLALAICLDEAGAMRAPTEAIRKRPVAIERGLFREAEHIHPEMLRTGIERMTTGMPAGQRAPIGLMELSVNNVVEPADVPDADYLRRLRCLLQFGFPILLTRLRESYSVTEYLRRYSQEDLHFNLGVSTLALNFAAGYYTALPGGVLEALGRLFADNVKACVHPMPGDAFRGHLAGAGVDVSYVQAPTDATVTVDNLELAPPYGLLFRYLLEAGWIEGADTGGG